MSPLSVSANGKTSEGTIEFRDLSQRERIERAGKVAGALCGFGLLCLFVPVLHFILPPIFLIAGCVFGWTTYSTKSEIVQGRFACPICLKPNVLPQESMDFPRGFRCQNCHYDLTLNTPSVTYQGPAASL